MSSYKKFMRLCEMWPKDASRRKDLGQFLERKVIKTFSKGEQSAVNEKECNEMFEALDRIANNNAMRKYPMDDSVKITVSRLDLEGCHFMNSIAREEEYKARLGTKLNSMLPGFLRRGYIPTNSKD